MTMPFHIYLDLEVRNDDTVATGRTPPPLSFEETRTQPFLDGDASEYFCTIARFTLQTGNSLPVFIPAIDTSQIPPPPDVVFTVLPQNQTIYKISFWEEPPQTPDDTRTYRYFFQRNVVYVPTDRTQPLPAPPYGKQDLSSEYYYVRSYYDFIDMINTTLSELYNLLPGSAPSIHFNPPFMDWDSTNCTATLHADSWFFDLNRDKNTTTRGVVGRPRKFEIYFDARLYQLLSTLNATYVGTSTTDQGRFYSGLDYRLDVFGNASNTVSLGRKSQQGLDLFNIDLTQGISTIAAWNPIESIIFTSTSLPIHPSLSSAPKVISAGELSTMGSGTPNLANILTDFQIAVSPTNQYRPEISYTPLGEYRLIDMFSNRNLSRVDLQVYWRDKRGGLHPILLYPGCSASVKLLFRHKGFYLGMDM